MSGGFYGDEQIRELKAKVDLAALMSDYTVVRSQGGKSVCCCPVHDERTPSCTIYDDGHWHCFGCGKSGDAIDLVRERERCDFREAAELLARRVGMALTPVRGAAKGPDRAKRERLLAAMEFATGFYAEQLWTPAGAEALSYIRGRGFTEDTVRAFRLGWAPGRSRLLSAAKDAGHDPVDLIAVNVATDGQYGIVDRFFERLTFPICDRFGQPIGFSARVMPEAEARAKAENRGVGKYINTTDTALYHKGGVVWNLHRAREVARRVKRLVVMEGPTDVMAAHQAGHGEAVACMGTAITAEHLLQMQQTVGDDGQLLLLLDGDKAGRAAATKAVATAMSVGVLVKVSTIPQGLDVAELLVERSAA